MKENQAWYSSNIDYLLQSIACVQGLLNAHIAESRGEESLSLDDDLAELADIADAMPFSPALEKICETFDLSNFERMILLCCAGQAIEPTFPNLLAIAHNNAELNYPTFQLALQCFPDAHWDAFTEYRPLRRWELVHYATSLELPRACLQIDEAILHYLMGEPYRDPILTGAIAREFDALSPPISLQPSYQKIVNQIIAIFQSPQARMPIIQLCGTLRESQREIAAIVSENLELPLYCLPSDAIPSDRTQVQSLVMRWQRWYVLQPSLLLLEIKETVSIAEGQVKGAIDSFLESLKVPVLVATDQRLPLSHPVVITFDIAGLEYAEQLHLWQGALPETEGEIGEQLERLAAQFRLSPGMIQTASAAVKLNPELETLDPKEWGDRLWDFCRLQARPQLEGLAQRINVKTTWDDLVLPEQEKKILGQILAQIRQQAKVYQKWGFARKNQRGLGLTVLFAGTSGTGKTTAAEVLAHELNLDLYRIDLSSVMSKYIGETEKNLRRIFDAAETGGGILLFDEADALFGKRTQVKDSHDRHANIEVSYLLQRMEAYQGLAILTTNLKEDLDQAFLRRLRFVVNFPFPKAPERSEIWQRAFPQETPTKDLNYKRLGQLDITGGNIKSISLNAAFLAADANEPVMMKHILEATKTEYLKWGRSLSNLETKGWDIS